MRTNKYMVQKIGMAILTIIAILFAFLSFVYNNNKRIIAQNTEYISEAANQKAQRMEYILRDAQKNMDILSYLYAQTLKGGAVDYVELEKMAKSATFDYIEFVDKNGIDIHGDDRITDISEREYFMRGMQGESGMDAVLDSGQTDGNLVVFYSPLRIENEIVGVIEGLYSEEHIKELLYSTYFGEESDIFLCTENGDIIAGSSKSDVPDSMLQYIENICGVHSEMADEVKDKLSHGESYAFNYEGRFGPGAAYITNINETNLMIFQAFPSKITRNMINKAVSTGLMLAIALISALVIYIAVLLFINHKQKKILINENTEMGYVILGITQLFSKFIFVDLEKNTYKYLAGTYSLSMPIPVEGSYDDFLNYFLSLLMDNEEKKRIGEELKAENIRRAFKNQTVDICYEYSVKRDKELWERLNIICLKRKNKTAVQVLLARQDLTEFKMNELRKNAALKEAFKAAEAANNAKSDFLSRMSHDIRTPMNAIMGMTAIAEMNMDDSVRLKDCLNKIKISSRHLLGLINEVLDMSKIESGKFVLTEDEFNLAEIVENLVAIFRPQIEKKNQSLEVEVENITHECVIGDLQRLQQVFVNIMGNAVKFTPEGGKISMKMSEKVSKNTDIGLYEFVFTDTGIGMDSDFTEHMFEPFVRAKDHSVGHTEGTGLGMSIAKNIVHMMNGNIQVKSALGEGSEFTVSVYLRLCDDNQNMDNFVNLLVLVADDEQYVCENVCEILKSMGMMSEWVTDGDSVIERLNEAEKNGKKYFAVILDWNMPGKDGLQTTKEIRRSFGDDIAIIMLSSYDWSDITREAYDAGVNDFISKPLFKSRLVHIMKNLTEKKPQFAGENVITENAYIGKRVLIVEDNEINMEIAEEILKLMGFETESAYDGREAVKMMSESEENYYDLILMDIQMPNMNGYEAASAIRMLDRADANTIPIVAMSANAFTDDIRKSKKSGMNDHVAKPVEIEKLKDTIDNWVK